MGAEAEQQLQDLASPADAGASGWPCVPGPWSPPGPVPRSTTSKRSTCWSVTAWCPAAPGHTWSTASGCAARDAAKKPATSSAPPTGCSPTWAPTPSAGRAAKELRATGEHPRKRAAHATDALTAHELQIARLVSTGATTREVAQQLFLSPRTVEAHLRNIFPELGISSRRQIKDIQLSTAPGR